MIRSVRGRVTALDVEGAVIEVGGVGLRVRTSATTISALPDVGSDADVLTHLVVREDALDLYGFSTAAEREFFEALIGVSGIGPRLALAVCGLDSADALRRAVTGGDAAFLQTAPGVGKRTAERIIVELRDRLPNGEAGPAGSASSGVGEAREGLLGLGFAPDEVAAALNGAPAELDGAALVRHALTRLRR